MRMQAALARHMLTWVAAIAAPFAGAADLQVASYNAECNHSFRHDRCSYRTGLVGTQERHGIVCRPAEAATKKTPLVLVFHGHGSCAFEMARATRIHDEWPAALVVYPDGLPGVATPHDPAGSATGWQLYPGTLDDRDVKLVDAIAERFPASDGADPDRLYAVGHSNGSRFVGVLWAARSDKIRAYVFNAAQAGDLLRRQAAGIPARPVAMAMGRRDCVVPFNAAQGCPKTPFGAENYQEASINLVRRQLGIPEGATPEGFSQERGRDGSELGILVHNDGHVWPADLTRQAVRFMQRH